MMIRERAMKDQNITDFDIEALIDNELDRKEAEKVRRLIDADPAIKERYEKLCRQKKLLMQWWKKSKILN